MTKLLQCFLLQYSKYLKITYYQNLLLYFLRFDFDSLLNLFLGLKKQNYWLKVIYCMGQEQGMVQFFEKLSILLSRYHKKLTMILLDTNLHKSFYVYVLQKWMPEMGHLREIYVLKDKYTDYWVLFAFDKDCEFFARSEYERSGALYIKRLFHVSMKRSW